MLLLCCTFQSLPDLCAAALEAQEVILVGPQMHAQAALNCKLISYALAQRCCLLCRRAVKYPARWWPGSPRASAQSPSKQLVADSGPASAPAGNVFVILELSNPEQMIPTRCLHLCFGQSGLDCKHQDIPMCSRCHRSQPAQARPQAKQSTSA